MIYPLMIACNIYPSIQHIVDESITDSNSNETTEDIHDIIHTQVTIEDNQAALLTNLRNFAENIGDTSGEGNCSGNESDH